MPQDRTSKAAAGAAPPTNARAHLAAVALASLAALALLAGAPTKAEAAYRDAPPESVNLPDALFGGARIEDPDAPMDPEDEQPATEAAAEPETVTLPDGTKVVSEDLIVNYQSGATEAQQVSAREKSGATLGEDYEDIATEVVELERPAQSAEALAAEKAELEGSPGVESVEYNEVLRIAGAPNDPYFRQGEQRNISAVDAPRAWTRSRGGVRVAVLDTGCFRAHTELNKGKVVAQHDFYYGDNSANDANGHGTHVSSIFAADTNNGRGIAGGAPAAQIVCAKVAGDTGATNDRAILAGLQYAGNHGARVINMSLAGGSYKRSLARTTKKLYERGIFIAGASGNDCQTKRADYPSAYPGVLAVGGTERDGTGRYHTEFGCSNAGPYVDVAAPGESIWGADVRTRDSYVVKSGTSMASPHVAAEGALLATRGAKAPMIERSIRQTADDRGPRGEDAVYGAGLADFDGALQYYLNRR